MFMMIVVIKFQVGDIYQVIIWVIKGLLKFVMLSMVKLVIKERWCWVKIKWVNFNNIIEVMIFFILKLVSLMVVIVNGNIIMVVKIVMVLLLIRLQ